jgi:hypothetical protein
MPTMPSMHPKIEDVVQEDIGQQRTDARSPAEFFAASRATHRSPGCAPEPKPDRARAGRVSPTSRSRCYSCLVVVFERVVVVPPSGSVAVVAWLSLLPETPSR